MRGAADRGPRASLLGVVAAGGASRRMGRDKAWIAIDGEPLFARTARVLAEVVPEVVLASGPVPRFPGGPWAEVQDPPIAADAAQGGARVGPLAAIAAGLTAARERGCAGILIAACDMPRLARSVLEPLAAAMQGRSAGAAERGDARSRVEPPAFDAVYWERDGRMEPLCAAYSVRCLAPLLSALAQGLRRPSDVFTGVGPGRNALFGDRAVRSLALAAGPVEVRALHNVNRPEDLAGGRESAPRAGAESDPRGDEAR